MKPEFYEDYQSPHADPVDHKPLDFDWKALEAVLDADSGEKAADEHMAQFTQALSRLFIWLVDGRCPNREMDRTIGRRAMAMVWVLRPDLFASTPSLAQLADRIGQTRAGLSWHAADFSRTFGIVNRGQRHGWNRKMSLALEAHHEHAYESLDLTAAEE